MLKLIESIALFVFFMFFTTALSVCCIVTFATDPMLCDVVPCVVFLAGLWLSGYAAVTHYKDFE